MTPGRRKRINRLKKMILWTVSLMILLPLTGCIFLSIKLHQANRSTEIVTEQIKILEKSLQSVTDERDRMQALLEIGEAGRLNPGSEEIYQELPETEGVSDVDAVTADGIRRVYLTFDDGPSIYTGEILDILAEYDVKATFFVTGRGKEGYGDMYRRIVEEGHTLGLHSYSHEYSTIYSSLENYQSDLEKLRDLLYRETGVISKFYRFPGGSSNEVSKMDIHELIDYLDAMDISYFDWNISGGDASSVPVPSNRIVERVMSELPARRVAVVLLHDAANKHSTVEALPKLIEEIQAMNDGTEILPITEETMLIQHVSAD